MPVKYLLPLFVCLGVCSLKLGDAAADEPKPSEPTKEQLAAAKKGFERIGGRYFYGIAWTTDNIRHCFSLGLAEDEDLKKLPQVPFSFELLLDRTFVTDAGLKELKQFKTLRGLDLGHTT